MMNRYYDIEPIIIGVLLEQAIYHQCIEIIQGRKEVGILKSGMQLYEKESWSKNKD